MTLVLHWLSSRSVLTDVSLQAAANRNTSLLLIPRSLIPLVRATASGVHSCPGFTLAAQPPKKNLLHSTTQLLLSTAVLRTHPVPAVHPDPAGSPRCRPRSRSKRLLKSSRCLSAISSSTKNFDRFRFPRRIIYLTAFSPPLTGKRRTFQRLANPPMDGGTPPLSACRKNAAPRLRADKYR